MIKVLQIRSGKEQYSMLLKTVKDANEDGESKINFSAFEGMDSLQFNPFTEPTWQSAVEQFNRSMNYVDQKTAQILKMHLRQAQSSPRQVTFVLFFFFSEVKPFYYYLYCI